MRPTFVFSAVLCFPLAAFASPVQVPGLHASAEIVRDRAGIAHVRASDEHDLFFLQGWVHAEDRLFQMDVSRRRASGTLAELLGPAALSGDVQLRTFGLRRAAELSLPLASARALAAAEAYAEGVNAFVGSHSLPPEYDALRLTQFAPWTPLDSAAVAKLIAFSLAFDLSDIDRTVALMSYVQAGELLGFDGNKLFFQDLFRSAPFDPASTIPDALAPPPSAPSSGREVELGAFGLHPRAVEMGKEFMLQVRANPFLRQMLDHDDRAGSNQWAIAGRMTETGFPMLASDPHLALGAPSTFYPIHLHAGRFDAIGNSFAGAPFVIVGHNRNIAWGATVNPLDVTDVYQEHVVVDPSSPSGISTVFRGQNEHVMAIVESYRVNEIVDGLFDHLVPATPSLTLIVPRRNGPIVQIDVAQGVALSVQFTGSFGTHEVDTFLAFDSARNISDFKRALTFFEFGSQNFVYADTHRNIAYFTASAVPIREDLQQSTVAGLPPFFIRNGTGGNEWIARLGQPIPFEVLPLDEMPHIENPPAGFLINANNDPIGITLGNDPLSEMRPGGGIYYLAPGYDFGTRAGRITRRVREQLAQRRMSFEAMQSIQADAKLLDAEVFVPIITAALANAQRSDAPPPLAALAASAGVMEAVGRLAQWDTSTPTGIPEGFDPADDDHDDQSARKASSGVDPNRARNSVAATLYSVWRGQFISQIIDAHLGTLPKPPGQQAMTALRNLIDHFDERHGVGESGLDFFAIPGLDLPAEDRRDILVLQSLRNALDRLSGDAFAAAFNNSTDQNDYRWGKLHRIVFQHPMDGPFSVPPAFGQFPDPIAPLHGIPKQGGFGVVDASAHDPRADSVDSFMFSSGPSNRLVVSLEAEEVRARSVWPGGVSAVPTSPYYLNLLPLWLRNQTVPLLTRPRELAHDTASVTRFVP
jgi:penicillin G amidase